MDIGGPISWYQTKIANYDKQTWEKSIEQRILHGLESRPKKESTLNTNLLDVDLIRGTAFARAKPKHDWCAVLRRGFLRSAFPILYLDYWKRHLSPRLAAYLIFHFFIQLLQVSCFLVVNPLKTHVTEADVMVPLIMGLCLGILHSQITSAHGSHGSISATGPSAATVGATDVILANVTNVATAPGASTQGNASGSAEAFLCGQSNCYPRIGSDGVGAANVHSSSPSSKLKKWRCRTSDNLGHKYSGHSKDKQKAMAGTTTTTTSSTSSSFSHPLAESENLCEADERANEADEDSCAEENKPYQGSRPVDSNLQLSQTQQQQQQQQPSSKPRSHFLHARNRRQQLSGDVLLLRETPPDDSAVFSRKAVVKQPPSAGHDADVESDFYDMESKGGYNVEKNGTAGNGLLTGDATDDVVPGVVLPIPKTIRIVKKRKHLSSQPLETISCLRKRSNSLSPDFCFSKLNAAMEGASKTVLSLNGRPKQFSLSPPPEDVLKHFKEAKFRGVPDPEVFAEYFEQPNHSPTEVLDPDHQKRQPSACTKQVKKTANAREIPEGSKQSSEKLQQPPRKKAELRSERSVRQHAALPKALIKLESNDQLVGTLKADYQPGRTALQNMDRFTCSANGHTNQEYGADFDVEVPQMDHVEPRLAESTSSGRRAVTSAARTKQFTEAVGDDANPAPHPPPHSDTAADGASQSQHPKGLHQSGECLDSNAVSAPTSVCQQVRQVGFAADHYSGENEQAAEAELEKEDEGDSEDGLPTDTFTSRRRQRAKFLQLFWERAKRQRLSRAYGVDPTTSAADAEGAGAAIPPSPLLRSQSLKAGDVEEVCEVDAAPQTRRFRSFSVSKPCKRADAPRLDHQKSVSLTAAPTAKRSFWTSKRTMGLHVRNKLTPLCVTTFSSEDALEDKRVAFAHGRLKHGQTASETEYDRMNSDIGSDVDSSSESDAEGVRPPPSQAPKSAFVDESPPAAAAAVPVCGGGTFVNSLEKHQHSSSRTLHHPKVQTPRQAVYRRGAFEVPVDSNSAADAFANSSASVAAAVAGKTSSDRDAAGALDGKSGYDDGNQDPFLLWYLRAFHGITDQSSTGSLETVWCYIWENEKVKKVNLTLLDIGWSIIQAVERQPVSYFYPKLACIATVLLALLPLVFHSWYPQTMVGAATTVNRSDGSLTLVEFQSQRLVTPTESPLDSPATLALVIYNWLTDFCANLPSILGALKSTALLAVTPWSPDRLVIALGILLRFNIFGAIFFLLCVAERAFQQRLLYAKHFFSLTSGHRARKCRIPHFRLNKVTHVKCWLTLRSYLKKQGPQRSVESIITAAFYLTFSLGLFVCAQLLIGKPRRKNVFTSLATWDILACTSAVSIFLLRFLTLGTKITKKYRNLSVLITEQINVYLSMEKKPHKKEELSITNQVLRLAECLLKEVDGPYRICGWAVNPLVYNVFKLVLLSCFSALVSEFLGFKLKLYKLKLNPANW